MFLKDLGVKGRMEICASVFKIWLVIIFGDAGFSDDDCCIGVGFVV